MNLEKLEMYTNSPDISQHGEGNVGELENLTTGYSYVCVCRIRRGRIQKMARLTVKLCGTEECVLLHPTTVTRQHIIANVYPNTTTIASLGGGGGWGSLCLNSLS